MSSIYHRMSRAHCRIVLCTRLLPAYFAMHLILLRRHAALNNGRVDAGGLGSDAGGETGERHDTASGVDRGGVVASESEWGIGAVVHERVGFLLGLRKVQVKYEMLRARLVEGVPVSEAAAAQGYSRAAFYLSHSRRAPQPRWDMSLFPSMRLSCRCWLSWLDGARVIGGFGTWQNAQTISNRRRSRPCIFGNSCRLGADNTQPWAQ